MKIQKGEKEYTVTERKNYWSVALSSGALSVDYQVSKELCKTEEALREYVLGEALF